MEATAEKSTLAEQRAQKKAARRAAFIQEIAEAVADTLGRRTAATLDLCQKQQEADEAQERAQHEADLAILKAEHPLIAAFAATNTYYHPSPFGAAGEASQHKRVVQWAVAQGILPQGTTQLPDTKAQYLALASVQTAV